MQAVSLHKNSENYTSSNPSTTKLDTVKPLILAALNFGG